MKGRGDPKVQDKDTTRINERIRVREVRLIDENGEQLGEMTSEAARALAEERGYDLVEVAPNSRPPVCRIMDYGKYKYEIKKKAAASKAAGKGRAAVMKEVKMRPNTDEHDLQFKLKNARKFLMDGDKVKVTVMFRGREMAHRRNGYDKLQEVEDLLGELISVENPPQMNGRFLSMVLVPNRPAVEAAKKREAALAPKDESAEADAPKKAPAKAAAKAAPKEEADAPVEAPAGD
jgi:translation initiation factor IF-3